MESVGFTVSDDNLGPAVNYACWSGMGVMGIVVLVKTATKIFGTEGRWATFKFLQADDYFLFIALVVGVAQNVSVMQLVSAGHGRHIDTLSEEDIEVYQKSEYASYIGYVVTVGMAKLATFFFSSTLANTTAHRVGVWSTVFITILWTLVSGLTLAFQCPLPDVWRIFSRDTCVDQRSMWNAIEAVNIFLEVNAAVLPTWFLWDLDLSWSKKGILVAFFGLRVLVVPGFALRLYTLQAALYAPDRTHSEFLLTIFTQATMNLCVTFAALPFMRQLVDRIRPDWPSNDLRQAFGYNRSLYATSESGSRGRLTATPTKRSVLEGYDHEYGMPMSPLPQPRIGYGTPRSLSPGSRQVVF